MALLFHHMAPKLKDFNLLFTFRNEKNLLIFKFFMSYQHCGLSLDKCDFTKYFVKILDHFRTILEEV